MNNKETSAATSGAASAVWNLLDIPDYSKEVSSYLPKARLSEKLQKSLADPAAALRDANQQSITVATAIAPNPDSVSPYARSLAAKHALFFSAPKGQLSQADDGAAVVFRALDPDELARGGANAAVAIEPPEQFMPRYATPPNVGSSFFSPDFSEDGDSSASDETHEALQAFKGDAIIMGTQLMKARQAGKSWLWELDPDRWGYHQTVQSLLQGDLLERHLSASPSVGAIRTWSDLGRAFADRAAGLDLRDDDLVDAVDDVDPHDGAPGSGDPIDFSCPRGYVTSSGVYIPSALGYLSGGFLKKLAKKVKKVVKKVATVVKKVANNPVFKAVASVGKAVLSATPVGAAINAASTVAKTVAGAVKGAKAVQTAISAAKTVKKVVGAIAGSSNGDNTSATETTSAPASSGYETYPQPSADPATQTSAPSVETRSSSQPSLSSTSSEASSPSTAPILSALASLREAATRASSFTKALSGDSATPVVGISPGQLESAAKLAISTLALPAVETAARYDPSLAAAVESPTISSDVASQIATFAPTPNAISRIAVVKPDASPEDIAASAVAAALTGALPSAYRAALYQDVARVVPKWTPVDPAKIVPSPAQIAALAEGLLTPDESWSRAASDAREAVMDAARRSLSSNYDLGLIVAGMADRALSAAAYRSPSADLDAVSTSVPSPHSISATSPTQSPDPSSLTGDALNPYRTGNGAVGASGTGGGVAANGGASLDSKTISPSASADITDTNGSGSRLYGPGLGQAETLVPTSADPAYVTAAAVLTQRFGSPGASVVAALMQPPSGSDYAIAASTNSTWLALSKQGNSALLTLLWHSIPTAQSDGSWLAKLPKLTPSAEDRTGTILQYRYYELPSGKAVSPSLAYAVARTIDYDAAPSTFLSAALPFPGGAPRGVALGASILGVTLTPGSISKVSHAAKAAYAMYKLLTKFVKVARAKGVDRALSELPAAAAAVQRLANMRGLIPTRLGKLLTLAGGGGVIAVIRWVASSFGSSRISHMWDSLIEEFSSDDTLSDSVDAAEGTGPDNSEEVNQDLRDHDRDAGSDEWEDLNLFGGGDPIVSGASNPLSTTSLSAAGVVAPDVLEDSQLDDGHTRDEDRAGRAANLDFPSSPRSRIYLP